LSDIQDIKTKGISKMHTKPKTALLKSVFGVSKDPIQSYVERPKVDEAFTDALSKTSQIIIYGSSKQGKSALLDRHVAKESRTTVHCGPNMNVEDIYRAFLRQRNVTIETGQTSANSTDANVSISAKFKAILPGFGAESETSASIGTKKTIETQTQTIEFNLSLAQDVGEIFEKIGSTEHFYVIENFHYLNEESQRQFSFDLRTFEEMGIRFIILGVWREVNRLIQYNGDLQERVYEIPVEPWEIVDFSKIAEKGEDLLNIKFTPKIKDAIYKQAHGSVAIVQELFKSICKQADIEETSKEQIEIGSEEMLERAIKNKVTDLQSRHIRSLEAIAAGSRTRRATEETAALYLPYYFVNVMVRRNFSELQMGIERKALQELVKEIHPHPDNVRTSDVTQMLLRLGTLQANSKIMPPLFDFDSGSRRVRVVDSTLYFFIDNCNADEVMEEIAHPDQELTGN
jgi:hypothetical protein